MAIAIYATTANPTPTTASAAHILCIGIFLWDALALLLPEGCAEALDCWAGAEPLIPLGDDVDGVVVVGDPEAEAELGLAAMLLDPALAAVLLLAFDGLEGEVVGAVPLRTVTPLALLSGTGIDVVVAVEVAVSESCGMGVIRFEKEDGGRMGVESDGRPGAVVMAEIPVIRARRGGSLLLLLLW
ncbi:hypothetical protein LTR86_000391 [Recurvomyces mirabilis]|nr:hypothetical protein LTR86_000391 [Recurvomyces mirabilis]